MPVPQLHNGFVIKVTPVLYHLQRYRVAYFEEVGKYFAPETGFPLLINLPKNIRKSCATKD
jgi:hypothetical protein